MFMGQYVQRNSRRFNPLCAIHPMARFHPLSPPSSFFEQRIPFFKPIWIRRPLKCIPLFALLPRCAQFANAIRNLTSPFNKLQPEARRNVKRNMAMSKPDSGVIQDKCKHQIAAGWQRSSVATRGVVKLEASEVASPGGAFLGVEDVEVVAMQMNRVW